MLDSGFSPKVTTIFYSPNKTQVPIRSEQLLVNGKIARNNSEQLAFPL